MDLWQGVCIWNQDGLRDGCERLTLDSDAAGTGTISGPGARSR